LSPIALVCLSGITVPTFQNYSEEVQVKLEHFKHLPKQYSRAQYNIQQLMSGQKYLKLSDTNLKKKMYPKQREGGKYLAIKTRNIFIHTKNHTYGKNMAF
jgi:hypothetical protein